MYEYQNCCFYSLAIRISKQSNKYQSIQRKPVSLFSKIMSMVEPDIRENYLIQLFGKFSGNYQSSLSIQRLNSLYNNISSMQSKPINQVTFQYNAQVPIPAVQNLSQQPQQMPISQQIPPNSSFDLDDDSDVPALIQNLDLNPNLQQQPQMPIYQPYQQPFGQQQQMPYAAQQIFNAPVFKPNNCNMQIPIPPPHQIFSSLKLLREKQKDKTIVAIIVSFCNGSTYDNLFTNVQQKTLEGTQVLVYSCQSSYIPILLKAFEEPPTDPILKEFLSNLKEVDPDCTLFNWQCSSNYSGQCFTEGRDSLFLFLKKMLNLGYMCMFSDFSLKALINEWNSDILGNNPFVRTGETSSQVTLKYKPSVLKECPSAQLQLVGEMADGGKVSIHCLGGTILYSVNTQNIDHNRYTLQVLTINTTNPPNNDFNLQINGEKGSAGHILLRFKTGGCILTSMGHWVQLMKIDTSQKKLFEVAQREYGQNYASQMRNEYASMDVQGQREYIQKNSTNFIQSQAPCFKMNKKC